MLRLGDVTLVLPLELLFLLGNLLRRLLLLILDRLHELFLHLLYVLLLLLLTLEELISHLLLFLIVGLSVHFCKYLLVFRLDLRLVLLGQFGDFRFFSLVELVDNCLLLLLDQNSQLFLLGRSLLKFLFELRDFKLALLELCLRMSKVALQVRYLLRLKCTVTFLIFFKPGQFFLSDPRSFECIIAALRQRHLRFVLLCKRLVKLVTNFGVLLLIVGLALV